MKKLDTSDKSKWADGYIVVGSPDTSVRIVFVDRKSPFPIGALIRPLGAIEEMFVYVDANGKIPNHGGLQLALRPVEETVFLNLYRDKYRSLEACSHKTLGSANRGRKNDRIALVKLTFVDDVLAKAVLIDPNEEENKE